MWNIAVAIAACCAVHCVSDCVAVQGQALQRYERSEVHMGTTCTLIFYADSEAAANQGAQAAFSRIKQLDHQLSNYRETSEISQLARKSNTAHKHGHLAPIPVASDLWQVLLASQELSRTSDGAFDVTVGPLTRQWRRARRRKQLPPSADLQAALAAVGYKKLLLDSSGQSAMLTTPNMEIDLGGIAKGYVADAALQVLVQHKITRAMVDTGGDIALADPPPGKHGWRIVSLPQGKQQGDDVAVLNLANCGIATSGDLWQFVEVDGKRYSHIVDPRTGLGLTNRVAVSVVTKSAMLADGLASTLCVLGPEKGFKLLSKYPETAVYFQTVSPADGRIVTQASTSFDALPRAE